MRDMCHNGMVGRDRGGTPPRRLRPGREAAVFFKILLPKLATSSFNAIGVSARGWSWRRRGGREAEAERWAPLASSVIVISGGRI